MVQTFGDACHADTLIFSIKEAFFKAVFPFFRQYLEFSDAVVALSPTDHTFRVRLARADMTPNLDRTRIVGRYRFDARHLYTAVSLLSSAADC